MATKIHMIGTFLCAGVLAASAPSYASLVDVIWTGTVAGGNDGLNAFRLGSQAMSGLPYEALFRFDTTRGYFDRSGNFQRIQGGLKYGNTIYDLGPSILSKVTIGNRSVFMDDSYYSNFLRWHFNFNILDTQSEGARYQNGNFDSMSFNYSTISGGLPIILDAPYSTSLQFVTMKGGSFKKYGSDGVTLTEAGFNLDFVSIALSPATVPDADVWVLMIAGFGLTGLSIRRARIRAI